MTRLLIALIVVLSAQPARAQTPAQVRTQVDTWLANRWATVQTKQAAYLAKTGRYFQGLRTHTVLEPADGVELAPDNVLVKPTDQVERWADVITLPATMPCVLRIDTYDGPAGKGYVATVRVKLAGSWWERAQQVGPETYRTHAWRQAVTVP